MARRSGLYAIGLAIGLVSGLLATWLCSPTSSVGQFGLRPELITYDYRMAWKPFAGVSEDVVLVTIDQESMAALGVYPWPRSEHARAITNLADAGAKVIGADILFSGLTSDAEPPPGVDPFFWEPPLSADDSALVEALEGAGNVILAVERSSQSVPGEATAELTIPTFPHPDFEDAAAGLGVTNLPRDIDGVARRYLTSITHQDQPIYSMAVMAASGAFGDGPADEATALDIQEKLVLPGAESDHALLPERDFLINFRGPIGMGFERIPFYQVASGQFDPHAVAGRIVLIGATAQSLQDLHPTPVSLRGEPGTSKSVADMPGVEIIAHAIDTIIHDRFVVPAPWSQVIWLTVLLSLAMAALVMWLRPVRGFVLGWLPLVVLTVAAGTWLLWSRDYWLPIVPLALGVTLTWVTDTVLLQLTAERQERRLREAWGKRVSPEVMNVILANPHLTKVEGQRVVGTVFFSDLRGFTTHCSTCDPEQVVSDINEYLTLATKVIRAHGGTVHKFIGDGVMAVFGDPVPQRDHADRAVAASLEIEREMQRLRGGRSQTEWEMFVRIGLHSGELVAGDIGSEDMLEYTVMGETVSVAARLEGLNKKLGTEILLSADTAEMLDGQFALRALGEVEVRGRPEPLEVLTVEGGTRDAGT